MPWIAVRMPETIMKAAAKTVRTAAQVCPVDVGWLIWPSSIGLVRGTMARDATKTRATRRCHESRKAWACLAAWACADGPPWHFNWSCQDHGAGAHATPPLCGRACPARLDRPLALRCRRRAEWRTHPPRGPLRHTRSLGES